MIRESEDFRALWATESVQSGAPQAAVGALCAFEAVILSKAKNLCDPSLRSG